MEIWYYILMGLVQGLTEFLPVSSSGHEAIIGHFFKEFTSNQSHLFLTIYIHFATLVAVFIVYRRELWGLILDYIRFPRYFKEKGFAIFNTEDSYVLLRNIIIISIPTAIAGLLYKKYMEDQVTNLLITGIGFMVTASFLIYSRIAMTRFSKTKDSLKSIGFIDALVIGLFQCIALFPGVSRSGSTISAGLYRGIERSTSGKFSFFIIIPIILMAMVWEMKDADFSKVLHAYSLLSFVIALIVGLVSLLLLLRFLKQGKLHYFAFYLIPLGILCIALYFSQAV